MPPDIVAVVGVCIAVTISIVFVVTVFVHNGLVARQSLCDQAWGDIQEQFDLRRKLTADLAAVTAEGSIVDEARIEALRFAIASADVAMERAGYRYNAAAGAFNDFASGLPGSLVAWLMGRRPDTRGLMTGLVDAAVKGVVRIRETKPKSRFSSTDSGSGW